MNIKAIVEEAEKQRRFLYKKLGRYALRPYLTHLYQPLTNVDYEVSYSFENKILITPPVGICRNYELRKK